MTKKIEPQDFFNIPYNPDEYFIWKEEAGKKDWKIVRAGNKMLAILPTQKYDEKTGEIVDITNELFEEQKQTQIEINGQKCSLVINKLLGVDNSKDAEIKQLNMVLEMLNKDKNATNKLKNFQETKEKYRQIHKELKEKINNAKTIDEIKSYDFDEKIKEIGEIDDL